MWGFFSYHFLCEFFTSLLDLPVLWLFIDISAFQLDIRHTRLPTFNHSEKPVKWIIVILSCCIYLCMNRLLHMRAMWRARGEHLYKFLDIGLIAIRTYVGFFTESEEGYSLDTRIFWEMRLKIIIWLVPITESGGVLGLSVLGKEVIITIRHLGEELQTQMVVLAA